MIRTAALVVVLLTLAGAIAIEAASSDPEPEGAAGAYRTIYVTAHDAQGAVVTDLAAGDLTLTVGNKLRTIVSLEKATAPMDVAIVVNDGGSGVFQAPLAEFLQRLLADGKFSIRVLNHQPLKLIDYTDDARILGLGLQELGRRAPRQMTTYLTEAIDEAARELVKRRAVRPVIVVLTTGGESVDPFGTDIAAMADSALASLKRSGASLNVLMDTPHAVGPVLAKGPVVSGGILAYGGDGMAAICDTLLSQMALTYSIPDGKRVGDHVVVRVDRPELKLRAPEYSVP
jgi:hypothetical protein